MGDGMLVLSGIKESALRKLESRGTAVLELISFANLRTLALLEEGSQVFLTHDRHEELGPGTEGIVAEVLKKEMTSVGISMDHIDEREIQRARVKLRFVRYGRIRELLAVQERVEADLHPFRSPVIL